MALDDIRPSGQRALRWHGVALAAWVLAVGVTVNLGLLHGLHLHAMAPRYAAGAGGMYFFGFLFGGWWYARWCAACDRRTEEFLQHATPAERLAGTKVRKKKSEDKSGWWDCLPDLGGWGDDPISAILGFLALLLTLVAVVVLISWVPVMAMDVLAGYLAEIVLEFVIGASIYRHVKKPQSLDAYWGFMVRRTWVAGLLAVVLAGATGYAVQHLVPEARTLGEALHLMLER